MSGKVLARLRPALVLSVALALACSETPTQPESPSVTQDQREPNAARYAGDGEVGGVLEQVAATGPVLTPEGLRSRLDDPLIEELVAGLEHASLRESVETSLAPLAEDPSEETGAFDGDLEAAREVLRKASVDASLSADDEIALGVLRLTLGEGGANM